MSTYTITAGVAPPNSIEGWAARPGLEEEIEKRYRNGTMPHCEHGAAAYLLCPECPDYS